MKSKELTDDSLNKKGKYISDKDDFLKDLHWGKSMEKQK